MRHKYLSFLLIFTLLFTVVGCDELLMDENEEHFDVYYYPPDDAPVQHLGETKGIKSCRLMAQVRAKSIGKRRQPDDYVCCLIKKSSSCAKRMQ